MKGLFRRDDVRDVTDLAKKAGVSRDTLYNWWSGETYPRTGEMVKVARALKVPVEHLWAVYEGREPLEVSDSALAAIEAAVSRGVAAAIARLQDEGRLCAS